MVKSLMKQSKRGKKGWIPMTNLIPTCPQCGNRLFSIYIGGVKERVDDEMWCKVCKKPQQDRVKISYPEMKK